MAEFIKCLTYFFVKSWLSILLHFLLDFIFELCYSNASCQSAFHNFRALTLDYGSFSDGIVGMFFRKDCRVQVL